MIKTYTCFECLFLVLVYKVSGDSMERETNFPRGNLHNTTGNRTYQTRLPMNHTHRTRGAMEERRYVPPELVRTSAIKRVQFTRNGRRTARRMCLPERDVYAFYYTTTRAGVTSYHIDNLSGERRVFEEYDQVPDHDFVPFSYDNASVISH